jgi:SAM-dependent methyltransferase
LCEEYFQRWVPVDGVVLDLAAGSCEFTNAIRARRRIAVDLSPAVALHARGAEVVIASSTDLSPIESATVDTVFTSNFFEHLDSKDALLRTLAECQRVLVPGGRMVILGPNIRYVGQRYWDYFDHLLPLSHLSLVEACEIAGYEVELVVPRFLPYTVKSRLPKSVALVRWYQRMPLLWRVLGGQMLVVARTPSSGLSG